MSDKGETPEGTKKFDFGAFPENTLFYDRRTGLERRGPKPVPTGPPPERRAKKERRRRIDPTTFEKQYSEDELEFMNAMQRFKVQTGKSFPTHGEVLKVAFSIGYRKLVACYEDELELPEVADPALLHELPTDVSETMPPE